jgi:hypothetical protein
MPDSAIATTPVLSYPAGQRQRLSVTPVLAAGHALSDWGSFVFTLREDPLWGRAGADLTALSTADPAGDGWEVVLTAAATVDPDDADAVFAVVDWPDAPGYRRYVLDLIALGGSIGPVQLLPMTWVTLTPSNL